MARKSSKKSGRKTAAKGRSGSPAAVRVAVRVGAWGCVLGALAAACWLGGRRVWAAVEARPEFRVDLRHLEPEGYPEHVRAEAMTAHLRALLADPDGPRFLYSRSLATDVRRRLSLSPWLCEVAAVGRVPPNRLAFAASFRRPAAIVRWNGADYMVDEDGLWLPENLFILPREWRLPREPVLHDQLLHDGPELGVRWDGPRLAAGARLVSYLRRSGLFDQLRVTSVDVTGVGRVTAEAEISLATAGGAAVRWGQSSVYDSVPGLAAPAFDPSDGDKLDMLRTKLAERPHLRGIKYIDLRHNGRIVFLEAPPDPVP